MKLGPENERENEERAAEDLVPPRGAAFDLVELPEAVREQLRSILRVVNRVLEDARHAPRLLPLWPVEKLGLSFDLFYRDIDLQLDSGRISRELAELIVDTRKFFGLALMSAAGDKIGSFYNQRVVSGGPDLFSELARDLFHELRMGLEYFKFCRLDLPRALKEAEDEGDHVRLEPGIAFTLRDALEMAQPQLDNNWQNPAGEDSHEFGIPEIDQWERRSRGGAETQLQQALADLAEDRLPREYFRLIQEDPVGLDYAFARVCGSVILELGSLGEDVTHLGRLPRKTLRRYEALLDEVDELLTFFYFMAEDFTGCVEGGGGPDAEGRHPR